MSKIDSKITSKGEQTRKSIQLAIIAITKGRPKVISKDRKISIKAVADEAGVSNATIHNNHPDIADEIRSLSNKDVRQQRDSVQEALSEQRRKAAELRSEVSLLRAQIAEIASINATLMVKNAELRARVDSTNIRDLKTQKNSS